METTLLGLLFRHHPELIFLCFLTRKKKYFENSLYFCKKYFCCHHQQNHWHLCKIRIIMFMESGKSEFWKFKKYCKMYFIVEMTIESPLSISSSVSKAAARFLSTSLILVNWVINTFYLLRTQTMILNLLPV